MLYRMVSLNSPYNSKISLVTPEDTLVVNIAEPEAVPEDEDEEAAEE